MGIDIFVSYSSKDKVVADALVSALENENMRCWVAPRDIKPGTDWGTSITEAIHKCKIILLIFSRNSNQSKRVLDEVYYAISEEKTIIPFRIENLDPTGAMRLHLSSRHWLDAYHPSWKEHINRLINTLAVNLGREDVLPESSREVTQPPKPGAAAPKKKSPWLWIGLAAVLVIILTGVGILWNANRSKQLLNTPAIAIAELPPTESSESEPAESEPAEPEPTEESAPTATKVENPTETPVVIETEVVLNGYFDNSELSLDPQIWLNLSSIHFHENLFLNLTKFDIERGEIVPEAALSWTVSPDGRLYTFKLRTDIPWVIHTPGGETVQALDVKGKPRFLTAQDFIDGFRRICDPRVTTGGLEFSFLGLLKGCQEVFEYEDKENLPQDLIEAIGVSAIAPDELLIELEKQSGYFLSMTSMTVCAAAPQWAIDKYGAAWTNPGNIPTNGYYVIDEWVLGESVRWIRNPLLPEDMAGVGNIDVIEFVILEDENEVYSLWLENQLDYSAIPKDELLSHRVSYARETTQIFTTEIHYFIFRMQEAPFDNVHVRRAFSGAFDRGAFINEVMEGQGLAMKHLAPPIVFGAPAIDEVGVGYDLEFARAELAEAGYPGCQGFPQVLMFVSPNRFSPAFESAVRDWEEKLGCQEGTIQILTNFDPDVDLMWSGWISDYPDEHNFVGTQLSCEFSSYIGERACNEIDNLIHQAAQEINPQTRIELYAQIEEAFFGEEGEFPLVPLVWSANYTADHTWLERTQPVMGKEVFYDWILNMEAKLAATGQ